MAEKAVCYLRVSTPKQKRKSPAKQWEYIQEYVEDKGWQGVHPRLRDVNIEIEDSFTGVVEYKEAVGNEIRTIKFEAKGVFFEDDSAWERGIPGQRHKKQRSAFLEMLAYVKKNKVKHVFTCWTNRLYRNTEDMIELKNVVYELADGDFFSYLHLTEEQCAFSWANPDDYIHFTDHEKRVVQSKTESFEKNLYARKGKQRAFKEGGLTYKAPPGYKNIKEQGVAKAVIDEEVAPLAKKMFKLMDEDLGMTTRKLALKMGELGLTNPKTGEPYHYGTIQKLLNNRFYIGQIKYKGEWTESNVHEGIIPEPLFWRVQERLSSRNLLLRKKEQEKTYEISPFASLFKCHICGMSIRTQPGVWRPKTKDEVRRYTYLKCSSG
jgi:DNA invertase Pin-like site-specific DNA recombinase